MNSSVVISAMGCITPLGDTPGEVHEAMLQGKTAYSAITQFDASACRCSTGGEIPDFSIRELGISGSNMMLRYNKLQMKAAYQMLNDYGLMASMENHAMNCAVYVANHPVNLDPETLRIIRSICSSGGEQHMDFSRLGDQLHQIPPLSGVKQLTTVPSHFIAKTTGAHGPGNLYCNSDCGGITALLSAARAIGNGRIEQAIVSASFSPFSAHEFRWWLETGLIRSTTLQESTGELVTPFSPLSSGTLLSEGAGAIFLEKEEIAQRNGRPILARIQGGASLTVPGETYFALPMAGFAMTLKLALTRAGLAPDAIDLIVCNAPSVAAWDEAELAGISTVWNSSSVNAAAMKGYLGYLGPVSGLLDVILAVQSMNSHTAVPLNHMSAPPDERVKWVRPENADMNMERTMVNSAGPGGAYSAVILGKGDIHSR
ncbi:beta-ketoacyl synthase N-terminal-like domain-containing protein [Paenibacillus piscarius]|uniref:beta-ketoacyl synthase N-terminal-like domain-containing protein n=1 Tax=Paenibacillus piscarius TaxID=1089681 RepID=UPI001EE8F720|nr:beta-ketoacyl synthase N-terminal-like domain-containing protein [Paenibacillus piscarius]